MQAAATGAFFDNVLAPKGGRRSRCCCPADPSTAARNVDLIMGVGLLILGPFVFGFHDTDKGLRGSTSSSASPTSDSG